MADKYPLLLSCVETKFLLLIAFSVLSACTEAPEPSYPWLLNTEEAYCVGKDTISPETWLDTFKQRIYEDFTDEKDRVRRDYQHRGDIEFMYDLLTYINTRKSQERPQDSLFFGMYVGGITLWMKPDYIKYIDCIALVFSPSEDSTYYLYQVPDVNFLNYLPSVERNRYTYDDNSGPMSKTDNKGLIYSIKHTYYVRVLNRILQDNPVFHGRVHQARIGTCILSLLNLRAFDMGYEIGKLENPRWHEGLNPPASWIDLGPNPKFPIDSQLVDYEEWFYNVLQKDGLDSMSFIQDFLDTQQVDFLYYKRDAQYALNSRESSIHFPVSSFHFFLGIQLDYKLVEGREIPFIKDCLLFCPRKIYYYLLW